MRDNARPHTARLVSAYLDWVHITRFAWHARSPDLNPVEHVFGMRWVDVYGNMYRPPEFTAWLVSCINLNLLN
nr:unnamed protein product [Callosobruchus analis]